MKKESTWTAIIGAIIILLQATGIINANEGTSLTTYATAFLTSGIALGGVIAAIWKRHKSEGGDKPENEKTA